VPKSIIAQPGRLLLARRTDRERCRSERTALGNTIMDDGILKERIYAIIFQLTAVPAEEIKLEHELRADLGMDSVSSMELISMLTEEFDIDVDIEEAMEITDVRGVLEMAKRYLG